MRAVSFLCSSRCLMLCISTCKHAPIYSKDHNLTCDQFVTSERLIPRSVSSYGLLLRHQAITKSHYDQWIHSCELSPGLSGLMDFQCVLRRPHGHHNWHRLIAGIHEIFAGKKEKMLENTTRQSPKALSFPLSLPKPEKSVRKATIPHVDHVPVGKKVIYSHLYIFKYANNVISYIYISFLRECVYIYCKLSSHTRIVIL